MIAKTVIAAATLDVSDKNWKCYIQTITENI